MNLLFLMTDQQRFDCVGYAPDSKIATPHMDRIAAGCAFMRCQTVNPICQPARTALLTGKYPHQIGTLQMSGDLDFSHPTFPQALQRAGYWTAGVGKFHYLQTWPWHRAKGKGVPLSSLRSEMQSLGYDHVWESSGKQLAMKNHCDYCDYLQERGLLDSYRDWVEARGANKQTPTEDLAKDGVAWPFDEEDHIDCVTGRKIREALMDRPGDQPFYLLGSFCSPHKPFDPPQRFLDQVPYEEVDDFLPGEKPLSAEDKKNLWKLRRAYKATLLLVDEEIGKVLDLLEAEGVMEDTLIVLTSDHGEMMGDHYRVQKSEFWRESLEVPLAVRHPACLDGKRHSCPVELTDITATFLDAAGLEAEEELSKPWPAFHDIVPCRSLLPVIRGEKDVVRDFAFSECRGVWSTITSREYKYVRLHGGDDPDHPQEKLFHTATDAGELVDLAQDPEYIETLAWHRNRWIRVMETTPPAQNTWAPLL
ncbi:sulfatase-like hydrolase/transferase [Kiritimatiellaeota bacterium B1221]|nr:sulfatase-like hydrolase/transferase [Kiritimatiellaeota bacterium B1221]